MEGIASPWQIVLGTLTLVNYGDYLRDEGKGVWNVVNVTSKPLRSNYAVNILAQNSQIRLKIERTIFCASAATARAARMAFLMSLPTGTPLDCVITDLVSDDSWTLAQALIQEGVQAWTESERFLYSLELAGAPLTGSGSAAFALPILNEAAIDPLIVPAGATGTVNDGQLLVCRSLQCDGELDLIGECAVIGEN